MPYNFLRTPEKLTAAYIVAKRDDYKNYALSTSGKSSLEEALYHFVAVEKDPIGAGLTLAAGTNANYRYEGEKTALHFACEQGHVPLVDVLINNQADPNVVDKKGWTPLWYALLTPDEEAELAIVKMLHKNGASLNHTNPRTGQSFMSWAKEFAYTETVDYLRVNVGIPCPVRPASAQVHNQPAALNANGS